MKWSQMIVVALVICATSPAYAFSAKDFYKNKCLSCHSIGGGDGKGPDLLPVFADKTHGKKVKSKKHDTQWLLRFVKYPGGMIEGDPDEEEYKVVDKHAKDLYMHFNKKIMNEFDEESDKNLKATFTYIENVSKAVKAKKSKPLKQ